MGWFSKKPEEPVRPAPAPARPVAAAVKDKYTREEILEEVKKYLDSQNWHYTRQEKYIEFGMSLARCQKMGGVRVVILPNDNNAFTAYAICKLRADEDVRTEVMEYITRANYGLKIGNFEMDCSDGEIRYKTYLEFYSGVPPMKTIERYVDLSFLMMEKYGNGLLAVLFGVKSPEDAIKEAEA